MPPPSSASSFDSTREDYSTGVATVYPSWAVVVAGLYTAGFLLALLRLGIGIWRVHKLRRNTQRLTDTTRLDHWRRQLGLTRPVELGISNAIKAPTAIGFWRPLIILPESIYAEGNRAHLDSIFVHELAHVKRWDSTANLLGLIATVLYWYHPLVYLAQRALVQAREHVCDDWVLETIGDAQSYASALLEIKARVHPGFAAALRLDMAPTSNIPERVERILRPGRATSPRLSRRAAALVVVSVLALGLVLGGSIREIRVRRPPAGSMRWNG